VLVYQQALPARVQRYSPIYYPDSHANSAIVSTGLRLAELTPCRARARIGTFRHADGIQRVCPPHRRPAWQGFQGALHPRYTVLCNRARQGKITRRAAPSRV